MKAENKKAATTEITTEEVRMKGSLGELYGVLSLPGTEGPVPLIILSHGFGGSHEGHQDYAEAFVRQGFAVYNFGCRPTQGRC